MARQKDAPSPSRPRRASRATRRGRRSAPPTTRAPRPGRRAPDPAPAAPTTFPPAAPISVAPTRPPIVPSQVLFGETTGASLRRPEVLPDVVSEGVAAPHDQEEEAARRAARTLADGAASPCAGSAIRDETPRTGRHRRRRAAERSTSTEDASRREGRQDATSAEDDEHQERSAAEHADRTPDAAEQHGRRPPSRRSSRRVPGLLREPVELPERARARTTATSRLKTSGGVEEEDRRGRSGSRPPPRASRFRADAYDAAASPPSRLGPSSSPISGRRRPRR